MNSQSHPVILSLLTSLGLLFASRQTANSTPQRVVFDGAESEHQWALKDLNPDLPSDWTGFNYLVLEMRASSPQRFNLILQSAGLSQRRQMQPLANIWIRAAVPLQYYRQPNRAGFDLASVGKVPRNSFWLSTGGVYGPLNDVTRIGVSIRRRWTSPRWRSELVQLTKEESRFRHPRGQAGRGRVRPMDSGRVAWQGDEPRSTQTAVGCRGCESAGR